MEISLKEIYQLRLDENILKGIENDMIPLTIKTKLPWLNWTET